VDRLFLVDDVRILRVVAVVTGRLLEVVGGFLEVLEVVGGFLEVLEVVGGFLEVLESVGGLLEVLVVVVVVVIAEMKKKIIQLKNLS